MKPNKHKSRLLTGLCAVIVCMAAFSVSASAAAYYASDESGKKVPPGSIDSITISTENVELDNSGSNAATEIDGITVDLDSFFDNLFNIFGGTDALTLVGNLTLVDYTMKPLNLMDSFCEVFSCLLGETQNFSTGSNYLCVAKMESMVSRDSSRRVIRLRLLYSRQEGFDLCLLTAKKQPGLPLYSNTPLQIPENMIQ